MLILGRIACYVLVSVPLFTGSVPAQEVRPIPRHHDPLPDRDLSPLTNTAKLRLTLDGNRRYVLGTDPLWVRVSLTNSDSDHDLDLLWRSNTPLTGLTYRIVGPDGQTNLFQTCRVGSDAGNGTQDVKPGDPFEREIDLTAPNCYDFKLTKPGHYSLQVDFKRSVCPGPSAHDCNIAEEYGEFFMLSITSDVFEFDVLPPYTANNPAPSEATPPGTADPEIETWLNSSNSRMAAWASYFILRDHTAGGINSLRSWLESAIANDYLSPAAWNRSWSPFEKDSELDKERSRAVYAVLDALIQSHASLSDAEIQKIAPNEPVLALIFAMLPNWNEAAVLKIFDLVGGLKWDGQSGNGDPGFSARFYARYFAGEALADGDSRAFLDKLAAEFVLNLNFEVMPAEKKGTYFQTGPNFMSEVCGGGFVSRGDMVVGWPPIGSYGLSEEVPKQVWDSTIPPINTTFDPKNAVPLGKGDLRYTRLVSQLYGTAAFALGGCGADSYHWIELYGRHDERFETRTVLFVTGDSDYHVQLAKWVGGLGAAYAQILSDAGAPPMPLRVTLHGIDFLHPAPGSNVSDSYRFDFPGFPPAGVIVISR
jgi:hypothetical protein